MLLFAITIGGGTLKLGKVIWEGFFYYGCVEWQHTLQEIVTYILREKKTNYLSILITLGALIMPYAPAMVKN
jgi:hypothetical protein